MDDRPELSTLTPRQREMVHHLVRGLSNEEIADRMFVSLDHVRNYLSRAYRELEPQIGMNGRHNRRAFVTMWYWRHHDRR